MSLIITFMFEPAKLQMNWARARGAMNARAEPTQLAVAEPGSGVVALTALKGEPASVSDHHPNWMSDSSTALAWGAHVPGPQSGALSHAFVRINGRLPVPSARIRYRSASPPAPPPPYTIQRPSPEYEAESTRVPSEKWVSCLRSAPSGCTVMNCDCRVSSSSYDRKRTLPAGEKTGRSPPPSFHGVIRRLCEPSIPAGYRD